MAFFRDRAWPFFLSVLVHAAIVAALVYGVIRFGSDSKPPPPAADLAIEAQVVDQSRVEQEMRALQQEDERKERERIENERRAEEVKQEREAEEQRLEELRQQRAEEEEAERVRKEQAVEKARVAEQEAQRKAETAKKAAADKKRKDEAAARKKAADDAKQRAEREAELRRRMAEEEARNTAVDSGLLAQYIAQVQARVQRAWIRPPSARAGLNCVVYVTQDPSGEVLSVRVGECNGDDIVRQSIEAAVHRASPLPLPADRSLFDRNLELIFKPEA
jgi:colicin import membrane protein